MLGWLVTKTGLKAWAVIAIGSGIIVLLGSLVGLVWTINGWKHDSAELKVLRAQVTEYQGKLEAARVLSETHQKELAAARAASKRINERLTDAIETARLGADDACRWPDDWMQPVNEAFARTARP